MPNQNEPFEILVAPYEVYLTTGTPAFPDVLTAPPSTWTLLGTNGNRNYAEGGVTIEQSQTIVEIHTEGHTGPVKAVRTQESQKVRVTLLDLSLLQYTHALGGAAVTSVSTTLQRVDLSRAEYVREVQLLIRGDSPAADNRRAQYEIPRAIQTGNPAPVFQKGAPAGLEFEFTCLDDSTSATTGQRFGRYVIAV